jgi:hypothetical protein
MGKTGARKRYEIEFDPDTIYATPVVTFCCHRSNSGKSSDEMIIERNYRSANLFFRSKDAES